MRKVYTMKAFAIAIGALALATQAHATEIVAFGQTSPANDFTATANAAQTQTTLSANSIGVDLSTFFGSSVPVAFLTFNATSTDSAVMVGPDVLQHYAGSFCITSAASCGGKDFLSATFTDAAFGQKTGNGLVLTSDTLKLTSSVVPANDLAGPDSFDLGLSNVLPPLGVVGKTIAPFAASVAGTVSATSVPEPSTVAALGVGLLAVGLARVRRPDHRGV